MALKMYIFSILKLVGVFVCNCVSEYPHMRAGARGGQKYWIPQELEL